ncbi:MAG TPA: hypothetical protein EYP49_20690 [Anaerolineae bacterium]|nr:hypothetical protein [Anaerolineae bacterium]
MARKRASIKGMGADILFGEKAPPKKKPKAELEPEVDIEKLLDEEAELAEPELDAELEKAFGEEVMAMEPAPPRAGRASRGTGAAKGNGNSIASAGGTSFFGAQKGLRYP